VNNAKAIENEKVKAEVKKDDKKETVYDDKTTSNDKD